MSERISTEELRQKLRSKYKKNHTTNQPATQESLNNIKQLSQTLTSRKVNKEAAKHMDPVDYLRFKQLMEKKKSESIAAVEVLPSDKKFLY